MATRAAIEARVLFHPQAWRNDYAIEVDARGEQIFHVPLEGALTDDGELPMDNSHRSDRLAQHENAPEWVQEWDGPCWVEILNRDYLEDHLED